MHIITHCGATGQWFQPYPLRFVWRTRVPFLNTDVLLGLSKNQTHPWKPLWRYTSRHSVMIPKFEVESKLLRSCPPFTLLPVPSSIFTAASLTANHLTFPPPSRDICTHACIHERVLNLNMLFLQSTTVAGVQLMQAKKRKTETGNKKGRHSVHSAWTPATSHWEASYTHPHHHHHPFLS